MKQEYSISEWVSLIWTMIPIIQYLIYGIFFQVFTKISHIRYSVILEGIKDYIGVFLFIYGCFPLIPIMMYERYGF